MNTSYDNLRTFMVVSRWILLEWKMFQRKIVQNIKDKFDSQGLLGLLIIDGLYSFFSVWCKWSGVLLVGLKRLNYGRYLARMCCFGLSFILYIISYLVVCSILLLLVLLSWVLFLLFHPVFVCSTCKFVRELCCGFRWIIHVGVEGLVFSLVIFIWSSILVFSNNFFFSKIVPFMR